MRITYFAMSTLMITDKLIIYFAVWAVLVAYHFYSSPITSIHRLSLILITYQLITCFAVWAVLVASAVQTVRAIESPGPEDDRQCA